VARNLVRSSSSSSSSSSSKRDEITTHVGECDQNPDSHNKVLSPLMSVIIKWQQFTHLCSFQSCRLPISPQ